MSVNDAGFGQSLAALMSSKTVESVDEESEILVGGRQSSRLVAL